MARHSFSTLPSVSRRRTRFKDDFDVTTTMSVGKLYPVYLEEVLPGDDFSEALSFVSRLTTSYLRPVMDNIFMDVYAFYVPSRLCFDDYESVFGNPSPSAYVDNELISFPSFPTRQTVSSKTVADYLGLPLGSIPDGVSVLPFRAFALIYNQWFRNENTNNETYVQTGDFSTTENLNNNAWSESNYTGQLPYVGKIKDYFTSAVPSPQKGASIQLPSASYADVPVFTNSTLHNSSSSSILVRDKSSSNRGYLNGQHLGLQTATSPPSFDYSIQAQSGEVSSSFNSVLYPINFWAKTSTLQNPAVSVDQLRLATQQQLMLVADTMYGSRYREYIFGHYGVSNGDARMQVPEYLCGHRIPLNLQQVAQTSAGTEDSALASLGGYSYSVNNKGAKYFKSFSEHGYVIWVACLRQKHTYQQGIAKKFTRLSRDDFYDPLYAHIGYQPIYTSELFVDSTTTLKGDIFGYQEAWSEYKHSFGVISGEARTGATNSLDIYHFGDNYSSKPLIGAQFNNETPVYVDRTLAVPSSSQDQFIVNFHCSSFKTRVMPVYCEPGYMDHWNK